MTRESNVNDLLMLDASLSLSPIVYECFCFSDPAKSTKWILADFILVTLSFSYLIYILRVKIEWDREETLFILVSAVLLLAKPVFSSNKIYSWFYAFTSLMFYK